MRAGASWVVKPIEPKYDASFKRTGSRFAASSKKRGKQMWIDCDDGGRAPDGAMACRHPIVGARAKGGG